MSDKEITIDDATRMISRYHRQAVKRLAADALEEIKGEAACADMSEAREYVECMIDDCQEVIYTYRAKIVGFASDYNWESDAEDMGMDHPTTEQIAYLCLVGEVWEEVESDLEEYFEAKEALDNSDDES